jgi:hypothetical protein
VEDLQKDFVPYNFALRMKALGFDEPCFGFHSPIHDLMICNTKSVNKVAGECLAPTFSQAFRFFREKYKYSSYIKEATKDNYRFYIEKFDEKFYNSEILSYEEAELACLEKLIEIVEQKEKI